MQERELLVESCREVLHQGHRVESGERGEVAEAEAGCEAEDGEVGREHRFECRALDLYDDRSAVLELSGVDLGHRAGRERCCLEIAEPLAELPELGVEELVDRREGRRRHLVAKVGELGNDCRRERAR